MTFTQKPAGNPYSTDCQLTVPLAPNEDGDHALIITLVRAQDGACLGHIDYKESGCAAESVTSFSLAPHLFVPITGMPERLVSEVVKAQAVAMVRALERLLACVDCMDSREFELDFDNAQRQARAVLEAAKKQT